VRVSVIRQATQIVHKVNSQTYEVLPKSFYAFGVHGFQKFYGTSSAMEYAAHTLDRCSPLSVPRKSGHSWIRLELNSLKLKEKTRPVELQSCSALPCSRTGEESGRG